MAGVGAGGGGVMIDLVLFYCESMRGRKDGTFFFLLTKTKKTAGNI